VTHTYIRTHTLTHSLSHWALLNNSCLIHVILYDRFPVGDKLSNVKAAADAAALALIEYVEKLTKENMVKSQAALIKYLPSILAAAGDKKSSKDLKVAAASAVKSM
jgi:hypothetical protein